VPYFYIILNRIFEVPRGSLTWHKSRYTEQGARLCVSYTSVWAEAAPCAGVLRKDTDPTVFPGLYMEECEGGVVK
jgi:hypothetical protein